MPDREQASGPQNGRPVWPRPHLRRLHRGLWPPDRSTIRRRARSYSSVVGCRLVLALIACLPIAGTAVAVNADQTWIWPTSGKITQPFGCTGFWAEPRRGSCDHFHSGIDIANDRGTPVRAVADGVVELVGWDPWIHPDPDWMVIIDHGNGVRTMYAHLRSKPVDGIERGAHVVPGPADRPDGHDRPRHRAAPAFRRVSQRRGRSTRATISKDPCPAQQGSAGPARLPCADSRRSTALVPGSTAAPRSSRWPSRFQPARRNKQSTLRGLSASARAMARCRIAA